MRRFLRVRCVAGSALLALALTAPSHAGQNIYSVTGGWKSIRGTGTVNIPTFGTFPKGAQLGGTNFKPAGPPIGTGGPPGLLIQTTDGASDAPRMVMPAHFFNFQQNTTTTPNFNNPGRLAGVTIPQVNQLRTNFSGVGPAAQMTLSAGGRSGPSTVNYCPGGTQTGMTVFNGTGVFNPNCTIVDGTPSDPTSGVGIAHGRLVYMRTMSATQKGNQYGGFGQQGLVGTGDLAILLAPIVSPVNTNPPFTGAGQFGWQILNREATEGFGPQAEGMAFAQSTVTGVLDPGPGNFIFGSTGLSGIVTPAGLGPALGPPATPTILPADQVSSWGGPWTTGVVQISVTKNAGAPFVFHTFTLTGSDTRDVNGNGNLQLVSGMVSRTLVSGPVGNRAVIQMSLNLVPEPSTWAAAGAALLALALCHRVTRRR
jgi:hypothetical protein